MTLNTQSAPLPNLPPSSPYPHHGGGGRIRTYEGVSRQIYSLLPLAAWVPLREKRAAYSDFRTRACQCRYRAIFHSRATFGWRHLQGVRVQVAVDRLAHRPGGAGGTEEVQVQHTKVVKPGPD